MTLEQDGRLYKIRLSQDAPQMGHRPSVDVMFESLVPLNQLHIYAVLMTGMGRDGAKGMKALYDAGNTMNISESMETCVVYGMPRAAAELKCVSYLLPLNKISRKISELVGTALK